MEGPCLRDNLSRPVNYLRVSITDRCNLRCLYCMPPQGVSPCAHGDVLRYEEIVQTVRAAAEMGISKVRVTGGEPLVRLGVVDLIGMIAAVPGIDDLALTTNGVMLARFARELKDAGLRRVNVSLDTLNRERFEQLTRVDALDAVLSGIETAFAVGLRPVKINVVAMRGFNDVEFADIARMTLDREWHVRFIELMPVNGSDEWRDRYMPTDDIKKRLAVVGELEPASSDPGAEMGEQMAGPARYYRFPGAPGTVGFISPVSEHFCHKCNRLRLTADGRLRPCLLSDREIDLRGALRGGADLEQIKEAIAGAVAAKPSGHSLEVEQEKRPLARAMSALGG